MVKVKDLFKEQLFMIVGFILVITIFLFTYNTPFFWDAISKSSRASWFYENNFSQWVVPTEINSGHPPLWTLLLAFCWKLFGKTLFVSRLLLLSLNLAVVYQLQRFIKNYGSNNIANSWYLLLLLEPTYLAQTTILNNDVLLLLMCLIAANNIFKNRVLYSLALVGVLLCNLRGVLFFSGFILWDVAVRLMNFYYKQKTRSLILSYITPIVVFSCFLMYQYHELGWIIKSPSQNWASQRELAGISLIVKNLLSIVWVFGDFGRFTYWIFSFFFLFTFYKKRKRFNAKAKKMLSLWFCIMFANLVMIFSSNPIGHRYFMFLYLMGLFICINLTHLVLEAKKAKLITAVVGLSLIFGHFYIYPPKLPQGWDSSLAYLNYFEVKEKMKDYVLDKGIPFDAIGTKTRNPEPELEYLKEGKPTYRTCSNINDVDYYIYSNIENTTQDEEISALDLHWSLVKEYKKGGVFVRLYQKPQQ